VWLRTQVAGTDSPALVDERRGVGLNRAMTSTSSFEGKVRQTFLAMLLCSGLLLAACGDNSTAQDGGGGTGNDSGTTGGIKGTGGAMGGAGGGGATGNGGSTGGICDSATCTSDADVSSTDAPIDEDGLMAKTCTYNGRIYPDRVSWLASDGCNECSCLDGHASCSLVACSDGGAAGNFSCSYDGKSFLPGITFPSTDNCNVCECTWRWYHDVGPGPFEAACTLKKDCSDSPDGASSPIDAGADGCVYDGKSYPPDVYFQSADGCDECHCRLDGQVACTFQHSGCRRDAGPAAGQ